MKKDKNKKDEWEGFDDCAVCQVMKSGEADNTEGLMKAFREAEKSGVGKVGFENSHDDSSIASPYLK